MSPLQDDALHSIYTISLLMKTPRRTFLQSILALFIGRKCVEAGTVKPTSVQFFPKTDLEKWGPYICHAPFEIPRWEPILREIKFTVEPPA